LRAGSPSYPGPLWAPLYGERGGGGGGGGGLSDAVRWWRCLQRETVHWRSRACSRQQMACRNAHAAKEPKTTAVQRVPSHSKQITPAMTYTRSCSKHSTAASAAAVQGPAHVQRQADKQEKSGKRAQVTKPAVVSEVCELTPVKQASAATAATPKCQSGKPVAPKLIKAAAADKKVSAANGRRKLAAASGGNFSSTIKKQQRVKAFGAKADAKVKSAASQPSRAQTPTKRAQAGAKTAGAKDRK
jgi:hypothetical protein